jgi:DNA processing protein
MGKEPGMSADHADDLPYWLALYRIPGVGPATFQRVVAAFSSPRPLFELPLADRREILKLPKTIEAQIAPDWRAVESDLAWGNVERQHILTLHDSRYPSLLREIPDPPPLLFVRGDASLLGHPQLALVGSRNPTAGGRQTATDFARQIAQCGLVVTSGMALGIDAASHLGALAGGGWTIAVAGTGPDLVYPARHRELAGKIIDRGAVVTEFPPGTPPVAANFPRRNRIISGLSLGTLVVEAAPRSGSLITARLAAEQGREVFAVPGSIHNPLARGCHALIRQGAKLVETIDDILEELGPLAKFSVGSCDMPEASAGMDEAPSGAHKLLYENIGFEPISIDMLVECSGLTADVVSSMLLTLELQGRVTSTGGLYCRTDTK